MADSSMDHARAGCVQQVFLLEDVAGGGFLLTTDSIQRLAPWPDGVGELLGSVCAVLHALPALQAAGRGHKLGHELGQQAEQFLESVLAEAGRQLESCTGRLEVGSQVVYLGKAGGFRCGPVPWTQPKPLSAPQLVPAPFPPPPRAPEFTYDDPWEQALGWERAR